MKSIKVLCISFLSFIMLASCNSEPDAEFSAPKKFISTPEAMPTTEYDLVIRNGLVYDGTGVEPLKASIAIKSDRIVKIGHSLAPGATEIDAKGMAVAPGFINMLSWATESLIHDGRSMSDIMQGVTLEVMGEGWSMGPVNKKMKQELLDSQTDIKYEVNWTTLNDYLEMLQEKGISTNVASFIGATTLRIHEVGKDDRDATDEEMQRMKQLLDSAMQQGAMGLGSSLIYAPGFYAPTEELIELSKVVAKYDGMYISHMRSEGNK